MYKLTRKEKELMRTLGKELPVTFYEANEKVRMNGIDVLKLKGIDCSKIKGAIKPNGVYDVSKTVKNKVNHVNRLVTAFESGGMAAVNDYVEGVMAFVEGQFSTKGVVPEC